MTQAGYKRVPTLRGLSLAEPFARLVRDDVLVACAIEGVRGTWYVHRDLLEPARPFRGRTTLLSPFDPLVYDRTRALELWSFRYKLEIYVPAAKREFGYFVLPILHRDRLVGRIDPLFDRKADVLRVNQVYAEDGVQEAAGAPIAKAIQELARWLGAPTSTSAAFPACGGATSAEQCKWHLVLTCEVATMADVNELALAMPQATKEVSDDGRPTYLVHGKMFCFHRSARPDALDPETGERLDDVFVFRVADLDVKELLLADARGFFFTTPHWNGYAAVLLRIPELEHIDRDELRELVVEAWLTRAQKRVAKAWLAEHEPEAAD